MISCLTVTRPQRLALLRLAIADFARQVYRERELVVVHDGGAGFERALDALAREHPDAAVRILAVDPGRTLGELRNAALDHARGEFVCQWDDDDRYHPQRLALQRDALVREDAACCFLSDQLHWFPQRGTLYWDDWDVEPYPMNVVQGTLLARRDALPRYDALARGEDTPFVVRILGAGHRVARLRDAGWSYVYVYHGTNAWDEAHHAAISRLKHLRPARLLARETELRARLAEYVPPLPRARMSCGDGVLVVGESEAHGRKGRASTL
jgi:glycosyltransferase involved in cell wall biosynthesis